MKVTYPEGSKCLISVLNTSDNALPAVVLNATATVSNNDDDDDDDVDDGDGDGNGDGDDDVVQLWVNYMQHCNLIANYWLQSNLDIKYKIITLKCLAKLQTTNYLI